MARLGSDGPTCTLKHHSGLLTCSARFPHEHHCPACAHPFRSAGAEEPALTAQSGFQHRDLASPHRPTPSSDPTCDVDHDAADFGYATGFHFARVVAVVFRRGHHGVHSLAAVAVVCDNLPVLLDDDFRERLGLVRHLNSALDLEVISFCDLSLGDDVEFGIREGFYGKEDKLVGLRFKSG